MPHPDADTVGSSGGGWCRVASGGGQWPACASVCGGPVVGIPLHPLYY